MSEENVELARRAAEMFNGRDLHGFLSLMAQDVRFQPQMGPIAYGHDGIRRLWDLLMGADLTVEVLDMRDLGADRVLADVRQHGGRAGGPSFEDALWVPSRWRQGECAWWGFFLNEEEALDALEATGLWE